MKKALRVAVIFGAVLIALISCSFADFFAFTGSGGTIAVSATSAFPISATAAGSQVSSIEVVLTDLFFPYAANLEIALISPEGTRIVLSNHQGAGYGYDGDYTFIAWQSEYVTDPYPRISEYYLYLSGYDISPGTYEADEDLSVFWNENPNGVWTLEIRNGRYDSGTLGGVTVNLYTYP